MRALSVTVRLPFHFLFLLFALILFTSCNDDDDQVETPNAQTIEEIQSNVISGTWSIILYNDSGVDETSDYNAYTFTFNSNGELQASNGNETYTGTWSVTGSNSSDTSNSDVDFNIAFSTPEILVELTDDWDVETYTSTTLELLDVSGGDGTTDFLTFEKN